MSDTAEFIERQVEEQRANVESTLEALKDRMSVDQVIDDVGQFLGVRDARGALREVGQTMRDNPVAVGLIGLGLAWLVLGTTRGSSRNDGWRDTVRDGVARGTDMGRDTYRAAEDLGNRAWDTAKDMREDALDAADTASATARETWRDIKHEAGSLTEKASDLVGRVKDTVTETATAAKDAVTSAASRAGGAIQSTLGSSSQGSGVMARIEHNPLVFGAAALVAGAVIGAALPRTETENRLMGDQRDRLVDGARSVSAHLRERAVHAAQGTYDAAVDAAQSEGLLPDGGKTIAARVADVASATIEAARDEFEPVLHETLDETLGGLPSDQSVTDGDVFNSADQTPSDKRRRG